MDALYRLSYIGLPLLRHTAEYGISPGISILDPSSKIPLYPRTIRSMQVRMVIANIQSGIAVTKGYRQYLTSGWRYLLPNDGTGVIDAGTFLKIEEADLALLTEVDGGSRRSRGISQLEVIARTADLTHYQFFPTRNSGTSINEGNAVLSRFPIKSHRLHPLQSRVNPRVLGETVLDIEGMLVAHLALSSRPRESQLREIAARIAEIEGPIILGGDFNERDHRSFALLRKAGLEVITIASYPSWRPRHALQVLFHSHDVDILSTCVPDNSRFSDHLPLIVEAQLGAPLPSDQRSIAQTALP
jgi:endonuclease/exonuclease/phosphatase family metal-dependent hydrolase